MTHPYYLKDLPAGDGTTPNTLIWEFVESCSQLGDHLPLSRCEAAQSGNPENMYVNQALEDNHVFPNGYFSGGWSFKRGSFGWLKPSHRMVHVCPNMYFDFSLIQFWKVGYPLHPMFST